MRTGQPWKGKGRLNEEVERGMLVGKIQKQYEAKKGD